MTRTSSLQFRLLPAWKSQEATLMPPARTRNARCPISCRLMSKRPAGLEKLTRQTLPPMQRDSRMFAYTYTSTLGVVECRAEAISDGGFATIVVLVRPIPSGHDVLRHQCSGSDGDPADAAAKARAWAERNFPPVPATA